MGGSPACSRSWTSLRGEAPRALVPARHEVRHVVGDLRDVRLDDDALDLPDDVLQVVDLRLERAALGLEVDRHVALHGGHEADDLLLADLHARGRCRRAARRGSAHRRRGPCARGGDRSTAGRAGPCPRRRPRGRSPPGRTARGAPAGGTSAAASLKETTPRSRATRTHSSLLIRPFGSAQLRKNIIAVRSPMARSSSSRVSTVTTLRPRQQDLRLVAAAVALLLDDLEGQAGRVRQLGDLLRVAFGHRGRGGHRDRGGGSRGHHRRGNADELGDPGAGLLLQVGDVHEVPRGLLHRPDDLRRHQRPAEDGHRAHAVDDGLHAEARVDRALRTALAGRGRPSERRRSRRRHHRLQDPAPLHGRSLPRRALVP